MLKLYHGVPKGDLFVAVSGGIDSMVLADFISRCHANRLVLLHVNHNTAFADTAERLVTSWANKKSIPLITYKISAPIEKGMSKEEFWRNERYKFFKRFCSGTVLLAHHLNDVMETWVFSSVNGTPSLMEYRHANCVRPLLLTSKNEIIDYAEAKDVRYIDDPSNVDIAYARNRIRYNVIPELLKVNPGLGKMLAKKLKQRAEKEKEG